MNQVVQRDVLPQSLTVSVLVPLHNAGPFIQAALHSLLQERRIALEVIVINDRSQDHSVREVLQLQDERIWLIESEAPGIAATLNTGLRVTTGDVIVRCDADDLYPSDRLFRQVEWLRQHPEYGAICGSYTAIDPRGRAVIPLSVAQAGEITAELQQGITRTHLGTFAIRADVVKKLGGFRPYFVTAEDIDFQLRLSQVCRIWYEPANDYYYRIHNSSITHTQKSSKREFYEAIAREFHTQRQETGIDDLERGCAPVPHIQADRPFHAAHHIQGFLLGKAWHVFQDGHKRQALTTGLRAAFTAPGNLAVWHSLAAMMVKSVVTF